MRRALLIIFSVAATITPACAPYHVYHRPQAGVTTPVPISQEHHHHLVLENSYVKAYEVEVPAHEATLLHQHDYDYVYVVLGGAEVTNTMVGEQAVRMHLPDTTVNFAKGPFAHIAGNVGDTPFRNVTVSLLHKQGDVKTYYPSVAAALSPVAQASPAAQGGATRGFREVILLETDEVRVVAVELAQATSWPSTTDGHARLVIALDRMQDTTGPREKAAPTFPAALLKWIPAGQKWAFSNDTQYQMKFVVLEFTD